MKKVLLLPVLFLGVLLCSCSKSGDDEGLGDPPPGATTIKFTNSLSYNWNNTLLGTIKSTGEVILIKNIGSINVGATTAAIETKDKTITKVFLYYDDPNTGKTYLTDYGFAVSQGTVNNWTLTTNLHLSPIEKTSPLYPK